MNLWKRVRRWFIAGLIFLAPAYITFLAVAWLLEHLDTPARELLAKYTGVSIPGTGIILTLAFILIAGAIASNIALRQIIRWFELLLDRIPLVRTLYSGVKQLIAPFGEEGESSTFSSVVIVEYPSPGMYSLGFLIKAQAARTEDGTTLSAVLVPTNHLHLGNVVLVRAEHLHKVDLNAEEGLKFLVSMGAALEKPLKFEKLGPFRSGPGADNDVTGRHDTKPV